ncbi:hypothetical protein M3T53_03950 [Actinomyces sp. B33]|uniref:hypothetical protein n=1 Tax=Actinomyces sp. B33 TaxID=2942131 RepID=UPI00233FC5CA|nr:hypothetical protein [Actinomyces sp. B33]MDC4232866.1 hypothetical protein [Actinomyces sp. B33]
MKLIKQYSAAALTALVALVSAVVGVLSLTVLAPPQEQGSRALVPTTLVMTRDGVLPLLSDAVRVSAESASGADVHLILGTSSDVVGWIGDDSYTEVIGIDADRDSLKLQEHSSRPGADRAQSGEAQSGEAQSGEAQSGEAQSGAPQSAAQSGQAAQSGADPQSGGEPQSGSGEADRSGPRPRAAALAEELEASDMWLDRASGAGSAQLDLRSIPAGRSIIAMSSAGDGDLTLRLTWAVERPNTLGIVAFLLAGVFALATVLLAVGRRRTLADRADRADRLARRAGADITDTQSINTAQVAAMAEAERANRAGDGPAAGAGAAGDEALANGEPTVGEPIDEQREETPVADLPAIDAPAAQHVDEPTGPVGEPAGEAAAGGGDEHPDRGRTGEPPTVRGRHGSTDGPIDEDPPETVPTDTGIIDLSAVRPGAALPTRRALREAREKGEEKIVIDGHEFDTGLIPVVPSPSKDSRDETPTPQETPDAAGTADEDAESTARGGWTSVLSSWFSRGKGADR